MLPKSSCLRGDYEETFSNDTAYDFVDFSQISPQLSLLQPQELFSGPSVRVHSIPVAKDLWCLNTG